jgi:thiol:disulfide interchange protein DsbD
VGTWRGFRVVKKVVGIAALASAAVLLAMAVVHRGGGERPGIAWRPFSREAVARATREGKPVVIHFSAAWCLPCHELEVRTFSDPEVMRLSALVVPLKVDLTRSGPAETEIKNSFMVRGVPTIIFIDKAGAEIKGLRATGFIDARDFKERIEALAGSGRGE